LRGTTSQPWHEGQQPFAPGAKFALGVTHGGTTIRIGPDADGDGVIDEVRSSETICNGASCVATESGGVITLECPSGLFEIPIPSDGTPGAPGVDGVDGAPGEPCMVFTETDGLRIVCKYSPFHGLRGDRALRARG
jgi:hypothetical protein